MAAINTTSPAALMSKIFDAVAAKNVDAMRALQHDDVVDDFVALGLIVEGKDAVGRFFAELFTALPDMRLTVERIFQGDDRTAIGEWRLAGTFSGGPFQGIAPTGRAVEFRGIDVMEFDDGLLRHNTIYYDGLGFARQVGMLPAEGSVGDRAITAGFNGFTKLRQSISRSIQRAKNRSTDSS